MKVLIKEENLKKIVDGLILERLGVPDNIINVSEKIYNKIISDISKFKNKPSLLRDGIEISISDNYNISNYNFNTVYIEINFTSTDRIDEPVIYEWAVAYNARATYKKIEFDNDGSIIKIVSNIAYPENSEFTIENLIQLFKTTKNDIISSLAHELKHSFDQFMKKGESVHKRSEYVTSQRYRTGIKIIDELMFSFYFMSKVENSVRSSQIAAYLKMENATKENFLKILESNTEYILLNKIANLTYDHIITELRENMDQIDNFLHNLISNIPEYKNYDINNLTDDEKISITLESILYTYNKFKVEALKNTYKLDDIFSIFHPDFGKKLKMVEKYENKVLKITDFKKYFEKQIKLLNFDARKTIKKIDKLYDYIN